MSYHYDSTVANHPNMLLRIRQLARKDLSRGEIHTTLLAEGYNIGKSTFYRTIREYSIVVRNDNGPRSNPSRA